MKRAHPRPARHNWPGEFLGLLPRTLIPAADPAGRPTLRRGATGSAVKLLQMKLNVEAHGASDATPEAAVREFQRFHGLVPDGIAGPATWRSFDAVRIR